MTALGTERINPPLVAPEPTSSPRQVRRRRNLPGGRAVVGGFLMAVSSVGVFGAYTLATAAPDQRYLAVARDVSVGERLAAEDLQLVPIDLPAAQGANVLTDPEHALDAVAKAPMEAGDLVQHSAITTTVSDDGRAQISLPVDPANVLNVQEDLLAPSDVVDVIVTYEQGGEPTTATISERAEVVRLFRPDQHVGGSGAAVAVLAVPPAELEELAKAAAAGKITLARTTGLERDASEPPASEPPAPAPAPAPSAPAAPRPQPATPPLPAPGAPVPPLPVVPPGAGQ